MYSNTRSVTQFSVQHHTGFKSSAFRVLRTNSERVAEERGSWEIVKASVLMMALIPAQSGWSRAAPTQSSNTVSWTMIGGRSCPLYSLYLYCTVYIRVQSNKLHNTVSVVVVPVCTYQLLSIIQESSI